MTDDAVRSAQTSSMASQLSSVPASEPLKNARHEAFAVEWAKGSSQAEAARAAGYSVIRAKQTAADIVTNRDVVARKEWLQQQTATGSTLTSAEKREILAAIARNSKERASDRIAAIRGDNDLSGDGSEAKANEGMLSLVEAVKAITHGV